MNPEMGPTIVPLPYSSRIDRHGKYRMSSHTALVTDATLHYAQANPDLSIYIPGESTFGTDHPSTSSIMRDYLIEKGIDPNRITIDEGLNDTESQLLAVRKNLKNARVLALDFHRERVQMLMGQNNISGQVITAEPIIIDAHNPKKLIEKGKSGGATPEKIEKIVGSKVKMLGMSKVYLFERAARIATKLEKPGKFALNIVRSALGKGGPTVTDYHYVDSASNFLKQKKRVGISS